MSKIPQEQIRRALRHVDSMPMPGNGHMPEGIWHDFGKAYTLVKFKEIEHASIISPAIYHTHYYLSHYGVGIITIDADAKTFYNVHGNSQSDVYAINSLLVLLGVLARARLVDGFVDVEKT